jgi:hypothetical protein
MLPPHVLTLTSDDLPPARHLEFAANTDGTGGGARSGRVPHDERGSTRADPTS